MDKKVAFLAVFLSVAGLYATPIEAADTLEEVSASETAGVESEDWAPDPDNAIDELMKTFLRTNPKFFDEKPYGLEGNYAVLGVENGNLGAGGIDRVRLLALRREDGIYDREILLEVAPLEKEPFLIRLSEDVKGFDSKIELKSFVSPRKSEVLLSVKGVDDNEVGRLLIVEVQEGQGRVIYDSRVTKIPTILGKFFDNYRAEVLVRETGARALIDLSSRKANYDRRLVYHEGTGTLRTPITVWEDRYSSLKPVDVDGDGLYELKGVVDLVGVTRSDRIAYVEFTLQYEGGAWHVLDSWVVPVEDLANLPIPRRIN